MFFVFFFFFNDTATTEIYTLSLHDALPICLYIQSENHANDNIVNDNMMELNMVLVGMVNSIM